MCRRKIISHYALLSKYDFTDIYEIPIEKIVIKVNLIN